MITNERLPWAMCHLDAEIVTIDDRGTGILECKSVGRPMYYKIKDDGIPDSWIFQMQHYLLTTDRKWGSYAILWADNWEFIHFDIEADKELQHSIIEAGENFWRMVKNGPAPERLDSLDKLKSEYATLKDLQQEAAELLDGKKREIQETLGDRGLVDCTGFRIYYKPIESTRLKSSALKKDDPEAYEKYSYKSVSRPFRIKSI